MAKKLYTQFVLLLCVLVFSTAEASLLQSSDALSQLTERSFSKKTAAVQRLASEAKGDAIPVFRALMDGRLYYRKRDKQLVLIDREDGKYLASDLFTGEKLGEESRRTVKRITINNRIRNIINEAVARLNLEHEDVEVRRTASKNFITDADASTRTLIVERLTVESDAVVRDNLNVALAYVDLKNGSEKEKIDGIAVLRDSLDPEIRSRLAGLYAKNDQGEYLQDETPSVRKAAEKAVMHIDNRIERYQFAETILFGVSLGSVLLLAAVGLAITFGVMGVINMAHGELIMIGAYTTYVVQLLMPNSIEYSLFVAIPAAFIVAGLVGIAIERGVIRFLYGRPLETLLATFGISLVLQQLVRTVFSPLNRSVETPAWMSGAWEINSALSITYSRLYIIIFSLLVFAALLLIMKRTSLGLKVRAVSQNREMARAMGIRSGWVDAMTFGLGSGIAGVAGVALSQLTNVGPNMGQAYIIDSFMVVVFGGVGNLWGTFVGAMSLGVINKFIEPWSGAVMAKILILLFIIMFIQKRPRGLFPQKGRAAED